MSASLPAPELLLAELLLLELPLALELPLELEVLPAAELPGVLEAGLVLAVLPGLAAPAVPEVAKLLEVPKLPLGEPRLLEAVLEAPRLAVTCDTAIVGVGAPPKVPSVPPIVWLVLSNVKELGPVVVTMGAGGGGGGGAAVA